MPAADQQISRGESLEGSLRGLAEAKVARFDQDLTRLLPTRGRIGVAVSGGPDSIALLLLAAAARPGEVEAATVDHGLRPDSAAEAAMVAEICGRLQLPHTTLRVTVRSGASLQAHARQARYEAFGEWAGERRLAAVLTAHHADDQAETLLMRLARGAGLAGLAGVRGRRSLRPGVELVRPLLGWLKDELVAMVHSANLTPVQDPANSDLRHDRTRARAFLAAQDWLDPQRLAASAAHLAQAEEALAFIAEREFAERHTRDRETLLITAGALPRELQRRLLLLAFAESGETAPRGADLDRALTTLLQGGACTLGAIKLEGGDAWRLSPAPPRR